MINAIIAAAGIGIILVLSEFAWRKLKLRGELARKFVHIAAGTFIAFLPFWVEYGWIFWLGIAFMVGNLLNRYAHIFSSIHTVKRVSWGDVLFGLAVSLCALIGPSKWYFMAGMLQVALADGLAAVVGVSVVKLRHRYSVLGHDKTLAGTLTYFVLSAAIIAITLALEPTIAAPMSQWLLVLLLPLLLTAVENIGLYGLDNVLLPLVVVWVLGSL